MKPSRVWTDSNWGRNFFKMISWDFRRWLKQKEVKVKLREALRKHTGLSTARNILPMFMRLSKHLKEFFYFVFFAVKGVWRYFNSSSGNIKWPTVCMCIWNTYLCLSIWLAGLVIRAANLCFFKRSHMLKKNLQVFVYHIGLKWSCCYNLW